MADEDGCGLCARNVECWGQWLMKMGVGYVPGTLSVGDNG